MGLFVKSDPIFLNLPFGTFGEPKGSEGGIMINDSN
jgi:hypothetical protein